MKNPENILSFLQNKTEKYKNRIALGMKNEFGWVEYTYEGLSKMSRKIASYLINELEVKKEEKIAILSESRVEFGAAFFACVIAGATFVPSDIKLTKYELISIYSSCEPTTVFCSHTYLNTVLEIQKEVPSIKNIILIDATEKDSKYTSIHTIENNYDAKFRHRSLNSTALIVYTSGTTGKPKGVEISFKNLLAQMNDMKILLEGAFKEKNLNILSILPMNHLFEFTVGFATFLNMGYSIYYTKSLRPKDILSVMEDKKIRFMITVPSFFRMLKAQFESDLSKECKRKQLIFNFNYHYTAKFLPFRFLKKYLFKDIHKKFGNNFCAFLSGGAPMDLEMGKYFKRIGIDAFQGYGLSEASPVVTFNLKRNLDMKSVGLFLNSFEAKISPETGELLVKGPSVMKGYYKQPELTQEVIEDGWLHTGDIAKIGKKGQVYITGRIKNMIVLPGGKKIFPEEVEAVLEESKLFKELCVLSSVKQTGEKKGAEEVCVVVGGIDDLYEKYDDATVEKMLIEEVKRLSMKLTQYKRPTNIIVYKGNLPRTATRKVIKKEVEKLICAK